MVKANNKANDGKNCPRRVTRKPSIPPPVREKDWNTTGKHIKSDQIQNHRDNQTIATNPQQHPSGVEFHSANFLELAFEIIGMTNPLDGILKSLLRICSRFNLLLNFFAQMNFQFFQWHGSFDPGGEHLSPPFRD